MQIVSRAKDALEAAKEAAAKATAQEEAAEKARSQKQNAAKDAHKISEEEQNPRNSFLCSVYACEK